MINLTINGVTFAYPETGDSNWGDGATGWAEAVTSGVLTLAGGSFPLTAQADFGSNFGIKVLSILTETANPSGTGYIKLANADAIGWRNAGNSADLTLKPHADGILQYNSVDLVTISGTQTLTNKTISGATFSGDETLPGSNTFGANGVLSQTIAGDPTAGLQFILGSSSVIASIGTRFSTGDVFLAFNAKQLTTGVDSWHQNSAGTASNKLTLTSTGVSLFSAASSSADGNNSTFWGSSVFSVSTTGVVTGIGSGLTTLNASNLSSGTVPAARLPNPTSSTLGGVQSAAAVTHQWINSISTSGVPALSQPAFTDISGTAVDAQIPTSMATKTFTGVTTFPGSTSIDGSGVITGVGSGLTTLNASNISSGTLSGNRLPNPSASTLGGVESIAVVSHNFLTGISTSGVPSQAQPAFTDISGSVAATQLPNPSATTLGGVQSAAAVSHQWINSISTSGVPALSQPAFTDISGTLAGSQLPTFTGDVTNSSAAMTVAKIAGVAVGTPTGTGNVVFSSAPTIAGAAHTGTTTFPGTSSIDGSGNAIFGGTGAFTGKASITSVTASGASSNGTMTVIDTTSSTSTVVLNTSGTATFGNISSQCGLFMVTDEGTGSSALFLAFGSGPTLQVVSQGGSVTFGIAASAANINLYTTANVLTLQNTTGSNKTLKITQIKTG